MKKLLIIFLSGMFVSCNIPVDDYIDEFADNATSVAETIAHNKAVETVSYAYAEKLVSSAKADINPIGYCKDKIEQAKEDFEDATEKIKEYL